MDVSVAMLELAINSLDAGATLVKITLRASRRVTLRVADNGAGMDGAALSRACEKGFSTKGSTGLGLYKTAQAASAAGGDLRLSSKAGKGTVVTMRARSMTVGDIAASLIPLLDDETDLVFKGRAGFRRASVDTRRIKRELGGSIRSAEAHEAVRKAVENLKIK